MRSCEEMTQLWRVLRGEVEGGDCGWDSRLVHRARKMRGVSCAVVSWLGPPDQSIHTQHKCDELLPHPPHTLGTREHRGTQKKCCTRTWERGNTGTRNAKEKSRSAGMWEHKGPQEGAPISGKPHAKIVHHSANRSSGVVFLTASGFLPKKTVLWKTKGGTVPSL